MKNYPKNYDAFVPLYGWIMIVGFILFGSFLLWQFDLWIELLSRDQTYLSSIILVIFMIISIYLGWCALRLSRESHKIGQATMLDGWAADYLQLLSAQAQNSSDPLQARLIEQVHGNHQSGWFISDLLLRLGLIGTVIGFVLMLNSVYEIQSDGIHALKQLMSSMGGGMQVALYTTLTGLGSAMLVSLQCHWLDRCSDKLVSHIIALGATSRQRRID